MLRFQTDHIKIGMINMIDNAQKYEAIFNGPIMEYAFERRQQGVIRKLGVSCHNPALALKAAKIGFVDAMLFSVNQAYN